MAIHFLNPAQEANKSILVLPSVPGNVVSVTAPGVPQSAYDSFSPFRLAADRPTAGVIEDNQTIAFVRLHRRGSHVTDNFNTEPLEGDRMDEYQSLLELARVTDATQTFPNRLNKIIELIWGDWARESIVKIFTASVIDDILTFRGTSYRYDRPDDAPDLVNILYRWYYRHTPASSEWKFGLPVYRRIPAETRRGYSKANVSRFEVHAIDQISHDDAPPIVALVNGRDYVHDPLTEILADHYHARECTFRSLYYAARSYAREFDENRARNTGVDYDPLNEIPILVFHKPPQEPQPAEYPIGRFPTQVVEAFPGME